MVSLEDAREAFEKYVATYDLGNSKIIAKFDHSMRACNRCVALAKTLKISKEKVLVAGLIGLLHDIGQFEQLKRTGHNHEEGADHALFGCEVLFNEGLIRHFIMERKYDNLIKAAITYHNKIKINETLSNEEKTFINIIRDIDMIDNLYITLRSDRICKLNNEKMSSEVIKAVDQQALININIIKYDLDYLIYQLCYVYDIYYKQSLEIIKKEKYVTKIVDKLNIEDKRVALTIENIKTKLNKFIDEKIGEMVNAR